MPEDDPRKTRILCVDDDLATNRIHAIVLGEQPDMDVVGTASRADEALDAIVRLHPDVVLLDYLLRGARCEDVLRAIHDTHPSVRVVILSGLERRELPPELASSGAHDFVTKGTDLPGFVADIRRAIRG